MLDPLSQQLLHTVPRLLYRLAIAFPTSSLQDREDAVYDAYLDLLPRYGGPQKEVRGLLYISAWRRLRMVFRRRCILKVERLGEGQIAQKSNQEAVFSASHWISTFERVIRKHGGPDPDALRRALLQKMETGETDGSIAQLQGIRRERLNIAWRCLLSEMLPE